MRAPILLIHWRRSYLLELQISSLQLNEGDRLYVFCDGPASPADEAVARTRTAIQSAAVALRSAGVDVLVELAEENLGCRNGVHAALDWFFLHVESGIILEDDCIPGPDFIDFASDLLQHFNHDKRIFTISGENSTRIRFRDSYGFLAHPLIWGWATWRDRWQRYDREMQQWPKDRLDNQRLKDMFPNAQMRQVWHRRLDDLKFRQTPDTWDYQFTYFARRHHLLSVVPSTNLVTNVGTGSDGTHIRQPTSRTGVVAGTIYPVSHPAAVCRDRLGEFVFYWRDEGSLRSWGTLRKMARKRRLRASAATLFLILRSNVVVAAHGRRLLQGVRSGGARCRRRGGGHSVEEREVRLIRGRGVE